MRIEHTSLRIVHIEASPNETREQLEARLRLTMGMIAVIDVHLGELNNEVIVNASLIASRKCQKEAYKTEQRIIQSQLDAM